MFSPSLWTVGPSFSPDYWFYLKRCFISPSFRSSTAEHCSCCWDSVWDPLTLSSVEFCDVFCPLRSGWVHFASPVTDPDFHEVELVFHCHLQSSTSATSFCHCWNPRLVKCEPAAPGGLDFLYDLSPRRSSKTLLFPPPLSAGLPSAVGKRGGILVARLRYSSFSSLRAILLPSISVSLVYRASTAKTCCWAPAAQTLARVFRLVREKSWWSRFGSSWWSLSLASSNSAHSFLTYFPGHSLTAHGFC